MSEPREAKTRRAVARECGRGRHAMKRVLRRCKEAEARVSERLLRAPVDEGWERARHGADLNGPWAGCYRSGFVTPPGHCGTLFQYPSQ